MIKGKLKRFTLEIEGQDREFGCTYEHGSFLMEMILSPAEDVPEPLAQRILITALEGVSSSEEFEALKKATEPPPGSDSERGPAAGT